MAKKKQIRRRVSKADWTREELRAIRREVEAKHTGNGPRVQSAINEEIRRITTTDRAGRIEWRRAHARRRAT